MDRMNYRPDFEAFSKLSQRGDFVPVYRQLLSDPLTSNMVGLKIRGERTDAKGAKIKLTGPLEESLSAAGTDDVIPNASAKFFELKGQSGKVTITVTSATADMRFAVIKIK